MNRDDYQASRKFMHDLLNPLAIADGFSKRLISKLQKNELTPEDLEKYATKISTAVSRSIELVQERRAALVKLDEEGEIAS